jgi:hypothetical protein
LARPFERDRQELAGTFWELDPVSGHGYVVIMPPEWWRCDGRRTRPGPGTVANDDGNYTVQFGGDPSQAPNVLPIFPGWNDPVRLYLARQEVIDGTWTFLPPQP